MSKRGENIYQRKDGRWEGRYCKGRDNGKIQYGYVYAGTYEEARDKLLIKSGGGVCRKRQRRICQPYTAGTGWRGQSEHFGDRLRKKFYGSCQ